MRGVRFKGSALSEGWGVFGNLVQSIGYLLLAC